MYIECLLLLDVSSSTHCYNLTNIQSDQRQTITYSPLGESSRISNQTRRSYLPWIWLVLSTHAPVHTHTHTHARTHKISRRRHSLPFRQTDTCGYLLMSENDGGAEIASTGKCKYGKLKYKVAKCVRVENTSTENSSTATQGWKTQVCGKLKYESEQGWKMQVRKIKVRVSRVGKCKYGKMKYGITVQCYWKYD